jgi:hypothetical protein
MILGQLWAPVRWLIPAATAITIACGGGEPLDVPTTGTLELTTSTTGIEPDPDGYSVQIDAQPAEPIPPSGSLRKTDIEAGEHTVLLGGVAANCTVAGANPRTVSVTAGETTPVPFHVTCNATSGSVRIAAATSGPSSDPDGYTITLDGITSQTLGLNAEITLDPVMPGTHSIGLSGVADNCQVQGTNPRNVVVAAGSVAALAFSVRCAEPPAFAGTLRITTSTTGPDQDEDGYAVAVDGGDDQPIGVTATATLANIAAGDHPVQLSGITANCTLAGANPRTVTVPSGGVVEVAFEVTCVARPPTVGALQVNTSTTGPGSDPDGYTVSVDGGAGAHIDLNGSLPVADLTPGEHSVGLSGLSDNCRVSGENPRTVAVTAAVASLVSFEIACEEVPTTTGTLTVITTTTGPDPDPDGYAFSIGTGSGQAIGVNTTVSVANLAAGTHSVGLTGVAANCTLEGDNPRNVTVPVGDTAELSFAIICTPGAGDLTITTTTTATTGGVLDPDGYEVSLDDGAAQPIAVNGTLKFPGLRLGAHTVALTGLAPNCEVTGENPRSVTILASLEATLPFMVTCAATTGSLAITISGLPAGTGAVVTVSGPGSYSQAVTADGVLVDLTPGTYTVTAASVTAGGSTYNANPDVQSIEVEANTAASVTVSYARAPGASLNLRIGGMYLTQSTQMLGNGVPLVAGRDGYLRVFIVANEGNTARPNVRVRFFRGGTVTRTLTIPPPAGSPPTSTDEGNLDLSWNTAIPGSAIEPGLSVLADVDPDNTIPESNEADNSFPSSGTPQALTVRDVPVFAIRFVPVRLRANGRQGNVTEANKDQFLDLTRRIYPLFRSTADVHAVYTTATSAPLTDFESWSTVLSEIYSLRLVEGSSANYYGVVNPGPGTPWAGIGYLGAPAAVGYDQDFDRSRVTAHELGHNWNRFHSPCGNPGGIDESYPYPGGQIGVYGFDVARGVVRQPFFSDVMGYCGDPWISDYTYMAVLAYRGFSVARASAIQQEQPSLLVWGRIVGGKPVLEPAFQVVTRPVLPTRPGPYRIEGRTAAGTTLFNLAFEPLEVADDPTGARHFAFAVPVDPTRVAQLVSLRLMAPGSPAVVRTRPAPQLRLGHAADLVRARRTAKGVTLQWNSAAHPMVLVRDPDTGEVLSFARGGEVEVGTTKSALDVTVSDQVLSGRSRVVVSP